MSMYNSLPIVVYVSRYQDEDSVGKFARFFDSYKQHPAGYDHELFIIKKGFQEHEDIWDTWIRQLDGIPFQIRAYPDRHFIFGYIRNLMEEFPDRYILICTATCEIHVDQWLALFMRHANPTHILSSMGSYLSPQTLFTPAIPLLTWENCICSSFTTHYRRWLSFWGYDSQIPRHPIFNTNNFYPAPNPHIRTACFMVPPHLLEQLFYWVQSENIFCKNDEFFSKAGDMV